jgi:hypothetical protein
VRYTLKTKRCIVHILHCVKLRISPKVQRVAYVTGNGTETHKWYPGATNHAVSRFVRRLNSRQNVTGWQPERRVDTCLVIQITRL